LGARSCVVALEQDRRDYTTEEDQESFFENDDVQRWMCAKASLSTSTAGYSHKQQKHPVLALKNAWFVYASEITQAISSYHRLLQPASLHQGHLESKAKLKKKRKM
jgi:hypothetical protein